MGLHARRHDSSAGALPPPSPPTISIPPHILHHSHDHHEPPPDPFPPSLSPFFEPQPIAGSHNRRESLPGLIFPPMSPPSNTVHSRRDSYPGPFPSLPSPSSDPPLPIYHVRHETCPNNAFPQLVRYESDPGLIPSTSSSMLMNNNRHSDLLNLNKRKLHLYEKESDLAWPFGDLQGLDYDDIRETAYEIFFTACRSSPGFGGRSALTFYSKNENGGGGSPAAMQTSTVKRMLGLKMLRSSLSQRMISTGEWPLTPSSPVVGEKSPKNRMVPRRQMTMAEVMRLQMGVSDQSDSRLRKTLMRTLVGQLGRQAETIILPLELLRHLKPSEFNDSHEYHLWQKRQLKILEVGLLLHPSIPIEKSNTFAMNLKDIIRNAEHKPLDTSKNSDTMRSFSNSVVSLSMRSPSDNPTNVCHWANGFPVNIHLYISLLQSSFDLKDETAILDEVDEQLELMKKTWSTLGINRPIHNVIFTWVLFRQYVETGLIEPDLLCASHAMLNEVANDAKKEKESLYIKILTSVLRSLQEWADKRLLNYHDYFQGGAIGQIENLLPVVLLASKILGNVTISDGEEQEKGYKTTMDSSGDQVDDYIRSSLKTAFQKVVEGATAKSAESGTKKTMGEIMLQLAQETEELAMKERQNYSPILKKWHSIAAAVAALTLNNLYGHVLMQYLSEMTTSITVEIILVLQRAKKLEDVLVQMVVEESADCEDGGKTVVQEMIPFEVESTILNLMRKWIDESLQKGRECLQKAKENEAWNPKSKSDPYGKSVVELVSLSKKIVQELFQIPIPITEDLVQELADGLQKIFREYTMLVSACGLKENYIPSLPPLTRCNQNSKLHKLWKIATPCSVSCEDPHIYEIYEANHPHSCTSRGTQRLYIRLNSLNYLLSHIPSLDKSLSLTPGVVPSNRHGSTNSQKTQSNSSSYFDLTNASILAACQHVSEVASCRLMFLDSNSFFYESLYAGEVANARISSLLTILKHNIKLMTAILTERAQALAVKEVMKASFDAFLMVLLAGGTTRVFNESDHQSIEEDFDSLKNLFITLGEELITENVVQKEAEVVEGVIALTGMSTEQLMENLTTLTSEASGVGLIGNGQKLPMPPTTGKWNRADPNTILRVLCYRNDRAANLFLKRTFQIAKRR
ncbi:protein unc-13 homolog [Abrus precatorius]|uniref:Protein unc-13 homolog n=1 Tax=Abrus precatorius TaxID=3816 RepID=A0A8B8LM40_ABRPR|nr:protein unc-13 homolog [Abrus precatorius]